MSFRVGWSRNKLYFPINSSSRTREKNRRPIISIKCTSKCAYSTINKTAPSLGILESIKDISQDDLLIFFLQQSDLVSFELPARFINDDNLYRWRSFLVSLLNNNNNNNSLFDAFLSYLKLLEASRCNKVLQSITPNPTNSITADFIDPLFVVLYTWTCHVKSLPYNNSFLSSLLFTKQHNSSSSFLYLLIFSYLRTKHSIRDACLNETILKKCFDLLLDMSHGQILSLSHEIPELDYLLKITITTIPTFPSPTDFFSRILSASTERTKILIATRAIIPRAIISMNHDLLRNTLELIDDTSSELFKANCGDIFKNYLDTLINTNTNHNDTTTADLATRLLLAFESQSVDSFVKRKEDLCPIATDLSSPPLYPQIRLVALEHIIVNSVKSNIFSHDKSHLERLLAIHKKFKMSKKVTEHIMSFIIYSF